MNDPFQMQRELRYGAPVCDQILTGRHFTIGYSWYFRQAKWVLEIINPLERLLDQDFEDGDRLDNFRADQRIPWRFRASLAAYKGSGYDRGHLSPSANLRETKLQNSETFLLSNMSPQDPKFNRKIWRKLEEAIRELDSHNDVMETYVLTAPVFDFNKTVKTIGDRQSKNGISIPIPHAFVKSVFAEKSNGGFDLWTFKIGNEEQTDKDLGNYLIKTYDAEQYVGGRFWDRVSGGDLHAQKRKAGNMWKSQGGDTGEMTKSALMKLKEIDLVEMAKGMGIPASVDDLKAETVDRILKHHGA
jgi:endonuclease G